MSDLVMAWARDRKSAKPRYILELDENERGADCDCECISCGSSLIAVNVARDEFVKRPHFRHAGGTEKQSCHVLAARAALLATIGVVDYIDPTGTNTSDQGRALMFDQELKRMDRRQEIVLGFQRPILCEKALYFEDDLFIDRMRSVSPILAAIDKRLPTEDEIKAAWRAGELRATGIPTHNPEIYHAALSAKAAGEIRLARQAGAKRLTAAELLTLDQRTPGPLATDMALSGLEADLAELGMAMREDVREMLASIRFDFNVAGADAVANSHIASAQAPVDDEPKEVVNG